MAEEKELPTTVLLKLRDQSSIFHDRSQRKAISLKEVAEFAITPTVRAALQGGAVEKATKAEYAEWLAEHPGSEAKAVDEADEEDEENTGKKKKTRGDK